MRNQLRALAVALIAGLLLFAGTACSSNPVYAGPPPAYYVTYNGQCYAPYEYSPYEIDMYGGVPAACQRVPFPTLSLVPQPNTLAAALMLQWTSYSGFYMSDSWYHTYYQPIGARYHVGLVSLSGYHSNITIYRTTYHTQISRNTVHVRTVTRIRSRR